MPAILNSPREKQDRNRTNTRSCTHYITVFLNIQLRKWEEKEQKKVWKPKRILPGILFHRTLSTHEHTLVMELLEKLQWAMGKDYPFRRYLKKKDKGHDS